MKIRRMTINDYDNVYNLWLSCEGMGLNNLDDSREGIAKFLDRNPETCFVAEDEEIKGVILAGNDGRRGYIYHTAVSLACRHRGVAKMLVDTVMDSFEKLGIHKVALLVFDRNKAGNAFWEAQGFSIRDDIVYRNKTITEMIRFDT